MMNDHYWCTRLGVERFLCGPKMAKCKSGGRKGMQWWTGRSDWMDRSSFTPLGANYGCHWINHFVCFHTHSMNILVLKLGRFYYYYKWGGGVVDFLASSWWYNFIRNKITKQLAFLTISCTPSPRKHHTNFMPPFKPNQLFLNILYVSTLAILH